MHCQQLCALLREGALQQQAAVLPTNSSCEEALKEQQ
jgi:hypothetical protein